MYERSMFTIICIVIPQFREVDYCLDKLSISFLCRFFSSGSARLIQLLKEKYQRSFSEILNAIGLL